MIFLTGLFILFVVASWAAEEAGLIKNVKGSVTVERNSLKITASGGMPLFEGDKIITGEDGLAGITMRDNTLLSIGPKSMFVINRFAFNSSTHAGILDASVKRGKLSIVSGKLAKNSPDAVKFHTPAAILGVRGTEFVIDAGSGGEK
jgi:hypothetical protein